MTATACIFLQNKKKRNIASHSTVPLSPLSLFIPLSTSLLLTPFYFTVTYFLQILLLSVKKPISILVQKQKRNKNNK